MRWSGSLGVHFDYSVSIKVSEHESDDDNTRDWHFLKTVTNPDFGIVKLTQVHDFLVKNKYVYFWLEMKIFNYDEAGSSITQEFFFDDKVAGWNDLDWDDDGVSNEDEVRIGSNPGTRHSDVDGLEDGQEFNGWDSLSKVFFKESTSNHEEIIPKANEVYSNSISLDSDNDKLLDILEFAAGTDPSNPDTDGDLCPDGDDPDPTIFDTDSDRDGVPNTEDNWPGQDMMLRISFTEIWVDDDHDTDDDIWPTTNKGDLFVSVKVKSEKSDRDLWSDTEDHFLFSERPIAKGDNHFSKSAGRGESITDLYKNINDKESIVHLYIYLWDDDTTLSSACDRIDISENDHYLHVKYDYQNNKVLAGNYEHVIPTLSGYHIRGEKEGVSKIEFYLYLEEEMSYKEKDKIANKFSPTFKFSAFENQQPVDIKYMSRVIDINNDYKDDYAEYRKPNQDTWDFENVIHANVFTTRDGQIAINYWCYYFFNDGVTGEGASIPISLWSNWGEPFYIQPIPGTNHEDDIEGVTLVLDSKSSNYPRYVITPQHYWVNYVDRDLGYISPDYFYHVSSYTWLPVGEKNQLELDKKSLLHNPLSFHPVMYVAKGGHACYFQPGITQYVAEIADGLGNEWSYDGDYELKVINQGTPEVNGFQEWRFVTSQTDLNGKETAWYNRAYLYNDPLYTKWFADHKGIIP